MKIPFDISKRPQIESGEYKVETECGHPVFIMDWDWIDRNEKKCLAVKVLMDEGFNIGYLFDYDGKRHSIFPSDSDSDLFLITPEPELSEFEKGCIRLYQDGRDDGFAGDNLSDEILKECSAELLELARKELEPEVLERLELAYKNQDDVVYENGKRDGKAEALKDLPRWRYKKGGTGPILHDCIVLNKYGCIGKSPSGALLGGVWILEYNELVKLPKED